MMRLAAFRWVFVALLWFAVLGSAAGTVYTRHRSRELFVELERCTRSAIGWTSSSASCSWSRAPGPRMPSSSAWPPRDMKMVTPRSGAHRVVKP
jgi:hypothetical protein